MKAAPLVSVCIANFNGLAVIDECVQSIQNQAGISFEVEIIVHDDASSDGSADHIRDKYPDVRLIDSPDNVGFCIANNRMAAVAQGEYLLLLNNDAALHPDALATLCQAAENAAPAIIGLPQYDWHSGNLLDIGCLLDPFLNPVPNRDPGRGEVGLVIGACLWLPKALWRELGGFPELFGSIAEDLYLCCRARLAGYPVIALGGSGYRHKVGSSFGGGQARDGRLSTTRRRRALSERNKTYVMVACLPTPLLQLLLPVHILLLALEALLLGLVKRDATLARDIYAPALTALWRERRPLAVLRRQCQGTRRCSLASWLAVYRLFPYKLAMLFKYGLPEIR